MRRQAREIARAEAQAATARGPRRERRVEVEQLGVFAKALAAALLLMAVKAWVHGAGLEFVQTLPLLTALMGGVVFTLAIILAGVLSDFKESERIVGELASQMRRLHADLALVAQGEALEAMRAELRGLGLAVRANLHAGRAMRMREVYPHVEALDRLTEAAAQAKAPSSQVRTVQVALGNLVRITDRLEVIVETTFMKAGYYYAWAVVLAAILALTFVQIEPFGQGLFLYGFAVFLLVGLTSLVADLDNPVSGHVRLSLRQLDKCVDFLAAQGPAARPAQGRAAGIPEPVPGPRA